MNDVKCLCWPLPHVDGEPCRTDLTPTRPYVHPGWYAVGFAMGLSAILAVYALWWIIATAVRAAS